MAEYHKPIEDAYKRLEGLREAFETVKRSKSQLLDPASKEDMLDIVSSYLRNDLEYRRDVMTDLLSVTDISLELMNLQLSFGHEMFRAHDTAENIIADYLIIDHASIADITTNMISHIGFFQYHTPEKHAPLFEEFGEQVRVNHVESDHLYAAYFKFKDVFPGAGAENEYQKKTYSIPENPKEEFNRQACDIRDIYIKIADLEMERFKNRFLYIEALRYRLDFFSFNKGIEVVFNRAMADGLKEAEAIYTLANKSLEKAAAYDDRACFTPQ